MSSSTEFVVEQKELTDENIKQFRKFTSQSVGQSISVPENNVLFFGYRVSHQGAVKILVCVGTVRPVFDDAYLIFPPYKFPGEHFFPFTEYPTINSFLENGCHIVEYIFTDSYYKRCGYGSALLTHMEKYLHNLDNSVVIRLLASSKAVRFFLKQGYRKASRAPMHTSSSVRIFKDLFPMEKAFSYYPV